MTNCNYNNIGSIVSIKFTSQGPSEAALPHLHIHSLLMLHIPHGYTSGILILTVLQSIGIDANFLINVGIKCIDTGTEYIANDSIQHVV